LLLVRQISIYVVSRVGNDIRILVKLDGRFWRREHTCASRYLLQIYCVQVGVPQEPLSGLSKLEDLCQGGWNAYTLSKKAPYVKMTA